MTEADPVDAEQDDVGDTPSSIVPRDGDDRRGRRAPTLIDPDGDGDVDPYRAQPPG